MGIPEISAVNGQSDGRKQLLASFGHTRSSSKHSRSASDASSGRTVIARSRDVHSSPEVFKRRRTQVAVVKLSWCDCVKGFFFGPKGLKQKLAATVEVADLEDADIDMFDHKSVPFIVTVAIFPNLESDVKQRQEAKCVFDTGCLQGNIISVNLARRLGFTKYLPLKEREQNGGTVATGHVHKVLGALHLSWYHGSSAKVFNDMRFLVSESDHLDLVVGTHSIVRHRLISPPNLGVIDNNPSEPERETLTVAISELKTQLEDLQEGSKAHKKKLKEYKAAELRLELHDTEALLKRTNTEKTKKAYKLKVDGLKAELQKYTSK